MENMTIVTGHKNPDTDSICCALTYTYVKQQLGVPAVACRAGKVSKETQYVLDAFKMEAPKLIEEVEPGQKLILVDHNEESQACLLYTSPSPRDSTSSRMPSSA